MEAYFKYPLSLEKDDGISLPFIAVLVSVIGSIVVSGRCGYMHSLRTIAIVIRDRLYVQTGSFLFAGKDVFVKNEEKTSSSSAAAAAALASSSEEPIVSGLYIHPVKSVCPVSVQSATIDEKGFVGDRRFMVVTPRPLPIWKTKFDPDDWTFRMVTQAVCPSLATVVADLDCENNRLTLTCKPLAIAVAISTIPQSNAHKFRAKIWEDELVVQDLGNDVAEFLTKVLQHDATLSGQWKRAGARLVTPTKECTRTACDFYTPPRARNLWGRPPPVACQDDFPILLITQASLDDLNRRLLLDTVANNNGRLDDDSANIAAVPMSRFRPNIVITGTKEPFEEDKWKVISINGVLFYVVKGCPRCKVTTIDTSQDMPKIGQQPLEFMKEFRVKTSNEHHIYFGQYAIPVSGSIGKTVSVGSRVKIIYRGDPTWADPNDSD